MKRRLLRPFDIVAVVIAIGAVVTVSLFAYSGRTAASEVSIQTDDGTFLYPLDQARQLSFHGPIGDTVVEIDSGRVRVVSSPCRDKICIAAGWLNRDGQWTACLPNRVFVRVEGEQAATDEVDAQTF